MSDLIDRQAAIHFKVSHGFSECGILYVPYGEVKKYLEQLPSAQPEHHAENLLAYAHDMGVTLEQAEKELQRVTAQPNLQQTCNKLATDCISRQDLITSFKLDDDGGAWSMDEIIYRLEQFPSAQPDLEEDEDIPMEYFENGGI